MENKDLLFEESVRAIINGDGKTLRDLLTRHPFLAVERYESSKGRPTLLHFVAANGVEDRYQKTPPNAAEITQILFDYGANPAATATFYGGGAGSTALVGLVSSVHPFEAGLQETLIEIFVRNGAAVDGIDGDGMPLSTALAFWYPGAANKLISLGARTDHLVFAAAAGQIEKITSWVQQGNLLGPNDFSDPFGRSLDQQKVIETAFVKACLCDRIDTIDLLLDIGISIDSKTFNGQAGLHEAAYRGSLSTVAHLIEKGARNFRDEQFKSFPIHWARAGGQSEIFNYLLDKTDLALADYAEFGMLEEVQRILAKEPGRINENNGWPLREAVAAGQSELVAFLMEVGADPHLKSSEDKTAIQIAKEKGLDELLPLLQIRT